MISVIIPTYRRYEMLKEAVRSVLAQTYQDIEIIVVDDCSNDETPKIRDFSAKIIYLCNEKNCGPGYSRRRGLLYSKGEYIVFLDDDDYYISETFFADALEKLSSNDDYVFVASSAQVLLQSTGAYSDSSLNVKGEIDAVEYLSGFSSRFDVPLTFATIFSRKHLEACGVFEMKMVNHMPMIMRSLQSGNVFFLDKPVGVYRQHVNNISNKIATSFLIDNLAEKLELFRIIKGNRLFPNYNNWWLEQIKTTVGYFVYGSHPNLFKLKKIERWCIANSEEKHIIKALFTQYRDYLIDYRVCLLKSKVKKVLGVRE